MLQTPLTLRSRFALPPATTPAPTPSTVNLSAPPPTARLLPAPTDMRTQVAYQLRRAVGGVGNSVPTQSYTDTSTGGGTSATFGPNGVASAPVMNTYGLFGLTPGQLLVGGAVVIGLLIVLTRE